jgi:hypothetical protein
MKTEWSRLPAADIRSIALSTPREGSKQDHALAAFYLLATGDAVEARARLRGAGDEYGVLEAFGT